MLNAAWCELEQKRSDHEFPGLEGKKGISMYFFTFHQSRSGVGLYHTVTLYKQSQNQYARWGWRPTVKIYVHVAPFAGRFSQGPVWKSHAICPYPERPKGLQSIWIQQWGLVMGRYLLIPWPILARNFYSASNCACNYGQKYGKNCPSRLLYRVDMANRCRHIVMKPI